MKFKRPGNTGPTLNKYEGFPHPYRSTPAYHLLVPLFSALDAGTENLCLQISLRPSGLIQANQASLLLKQFDVLGARDDDKSNETRLETAEQSGDPRLVERSRRDQRRALRQTEGERTRARMGTQALDTLIRSQNRLLDLRVSVASRAKARSRASFRLCAPPWAGPTWAPMTPRRCMLLRLPRSFTLNRSMTPSLLAFTRLWMI